LIDPPLTPEGHHHVTAGQVLEVIAALSAAGASTMEIGSAVAPLIAQLGPVPVGVLLHVSSEGLNDNRIDVREWCTRSRAKRALTLSGLFDARRLVETSVGDVLNLPGIGTSMAGEIVAALAMAVAASGSESTARGEL
jgi:hypothetical protein